MMIQRASFAQDLLALRQCFLELIPLLELQKDWYASIYFERKISKNYTVQLKQTQISNSFSQGVIFRIYNGYTLFEEASDDGNLERLKEKAQAFAKRVAQYSVSSGLRKRVYSPPSWQERLHVSLDSEIISQIPKNPSSKAPVHFGIRWKNDPIIAKASERIQRLKALIEKFQAQAQEEGFPKDSFHFVSVREKFVLEETIFVDRTVNLSQTLYRLMQLFSVVSDTDSVWAQVGGLGGLEVLEDLDSKFSGLLKDLKNLKHAEKLKPGKYRLLVGPDVTGVLAHEAFGHSQEGDTCARGRSRAWELYHTEQLAGNSYATIMNNPALFQHGTKDFGAWGSYFFDEEGWLAREQVLLDQGKLCAPMTHLLSALRLNVPRTANGKRENWAHGIYTRQTNTYFTPGEDTLEELMKKLGNGFLALHSAGGMEDPKGMGIQVGIAYLYEIKNGHFTGKIYKGPAGGEIQMTGYTPDILFSIDGKSKIQVDQSFSDQVRFPFHEIGGCGKYHKEFVHAGTGGPYLLLKEVMLG